MEFDFTAAEEWDYEKKLIELGSFKVGPTTDEKKFMVFPVKYSVTDEFGDFYEKTYYFPLK